MLDGNGYGCGPESNLGERIRLDMGAGTNRYNS